MESTEKPGTLVRDACNVRVYIVQARSNQDLASGYTPPVVHTLAQLFLALYYYALS